MKSLRVTGFHAAFRERTTVTYPWRSLDVSPRWRGRHRLLRGEDGEPLCIACGACERVCPDRCIRVTRRKVTIVGADGGEKSISRPDTFEIDLARCMYCNLCSEACPVKCLFLTADYAYSEWDVRDLVIGLDGLLRPEPLSEAELAAGAQAS